MINWWFTNLQELVEHQDDIVVYDDYDSMWEVAYDFVDKGGFGEISETLKYYIDYVDLGDALYDDGNFLLVDGCVFEYIG